MTITIELPDTTKCAFVNYLHLDDEGDMTMSVKSLDSGDIRRARMQVAKNEL